MRSSTDIANTKTRRHKGNPPTRENCPQITQIHTDGSFDAAVPRIDGGNVGDLAIANYR